MKKKITTILFDLDGTLLDTAPDLATALNIVLKKHNRPTLPFAKIRPFSSLGTYGLLNLGFGITEKDDQYSKLREHFFEAYHSHLNENTTLFPGIEDVLMHLQKNNIHWGVVTNKPSDLAIKLLEAFALKNQCACIIGGDILGIRKPEPDPLLYACEIIGCPTINCVYVGDAARDIEAAKRANMTSIAALYGYICVDENPQEWRADYYIQYPHEIISHLKL